MLMHEKQIKDKNIFFIFNTLIRDGRNSLID